jgi:hypothetical protein
VSTNNPGKGKKHLTAPANWSAVTDTSYCYAVCKVTPGTADALPTLGITVFDQAGMQLDTVHLMRSTPTTSSPSGGGSDTGLIVGVGAGAAAVAAAGGAAYVVMKRRALDD